MKRTGTPTQNPHNARGFSEEQRLKKWLRENGHIFFFTDKKVT
jgi:CMP-N-acetylneuraminic acid synthetase